MSCAEFFAKYQVTRVTQPPYSPDLVPCHFWLFPKLKSPLKGKRFQTIDEIQENTMRQLMATGRAVWGPEVPPLKGTEESLSCVQCFLYLVSSSVNVSVFHIMWLDTFWTDHAFQNIVGHTGVDWGECWEVGGVVLGRVLSPGHCARSLPCSFFACADTWHDPWRLFKLQHPVFPRRVPV